METVNNTSHWPDFNATFAETGTCFCDLDLLQKRSHCSMAYSMILTFSVTTTTCDRVPLTTYNFEVFTLYVEYPANIDARVNYDA